jgi:hypothetical protein
LDSLDVVTQILAAANAALPDVAALALRLAATIGTIVLLGGLAVRVATGSGNAVAYAVQMIIHVGLIAASIVALPAIIQATFDMADLIAELLGAGGIGALDVVARGFSLFARVVNAGIQGSIFNPMNFVMYIAMVLLGFLMLAAHVIISWVVATRIIQLFLGGVALAIVVPFALVPGLSGIGYTTFAFFLSAMVGLIVVAAIVGFGGDVFLDLALPDGGAAMSLEELGGAVLTVGLFAFLTFAASAMANAIARGASGGTGALGTLSAASAAGLSAFRGGGTVAGSTIAGGTSGGGIAAGGVSAASGGGGLGGAAARAAGAAGAAGGGGGGGSGLGGGAASGASGAAARSVGRSTSP